ncbi:porin family protein [Candidatus Seribacter sulfatis]|uniref:porin family protein n=1 Tax=Candidatus Seribacter sulfatis TaxID=3381756 RepID=UPI00389B1784
MIRLFLHFKIFSFLLLPLFFLSGQNQGQSIAERLAELKARSNVHENQVSQLLAERPLGRTDFTIPNNEAVPVLPPPPPPSIVPAVPEARRVEQQDEVIPVPIEPATLAEANDQNNSTESKEDLDEAYAKLYEPDIPSRLEGYYFGPILGLVFPQDGAIRTLIPSTSPATYTKEIYDSDSGYFIGLQAGKDFGRVRVEAEYSYHSFDAATASSSLSASIHNFFSRLILEKEIGDRFDIRAGLGMGIGIVTLEDTADYSGTGFAYDFLLGGAYRLAENWSLQVDYHYYLTAAHDHYDHIKSHLWTISASLDI